MKDKLRKLSFGIKILFLVTMSIAMLIALISVRNNQRYIVVQGEQDNGLGVTYGYKVENYKYTERMRITFWRKNGVRFVCDSYEKTVDKVNNSEWIKSNGAIFLDLEITYHDSYVTTNPTKIIYDFHRGEMYITSDLRLWRMWSEALSSDDWMSESEFDEILTKLRQ